MIEATNLFSTINKFVEVDGATDVRGLARTLGIRVVEKPFEDETLSGSLSNDQGEFIITVNTLHPETRKRFTIAHELGHFVFHRDQVGNGIYDDAAYRCSSDRFKNPRIGVHEETEANKFAAGVLMPYSKVKNLHDNGKTPDEIAKILNVSVAAIKIRLGGLDRRYL